MIAADQEARVLRLYHAEKWRVHTIARQLGLHHATVRRVLARAGGRLHSRRRVPGRRGGWCRLLAHGSGTGALKPFEQRGE